MKTTIVKCLVVFCIMASSIVVAQETAPQFEIESTNTTATLSLPEANACRGGSTSLNCTEVFNSWSLYYKGAESSPILFGEKRDLMENPQSDDPRKHRRPEVSDNKQDYSIKKLNLGVNEEVKRSSLVALSSLQGMQKSFTNDPIDRDRYLNMYNTAR